MPTYSTAIIADSTCDIPAELIERYHIDVIPQIVIWGDQELRDRIDLQPEEFYQRLSTSPQLPTTSQPTIKSFGEHYQAAQAAGATAIVVLTVSSAMSGTYQTAQQAAPWVNVPIHVIDAKGPTMSLGWQVLLPPFDWDLGDAGKGPSDGWFFLTAYNSERATGKLEVTASQRDRDYIVAINWREAEKHAQAGEGNLIRNPGFEEPVAANGYLGWVFVDHGQDFARGEIQALGKHDLNDITGQYMAPRAADRFLKITARKIRSYPDLTLF